MTNNLKSGKLCSICGKWFQANEFHYGKRENNSYCITCRNENNSAYAGGIEAARTYREKKRAAWKNE
jgi:hypothetical protein